MESKIYSKFSFDSFMKLMPSLFVVFTGLIYGTGFIVVYAFLDFIGAREAPVELFKIKFVYVGFLCLSLPVIIIGAISGFSLLKEKKGDKKIKEIVPANFYVDRYSVGLVFNLLFLLYIVMLFIPADSNLLLRVIGMILLTSLASFLIRKIVKTVKKGFGKSPGHIKIKNYLVRFHLRTRQIIFWIALVLSYYFVSFSEDWTRLKEIFITSKLGNIYILLISLLIFIISRLVSRFRDFENPKGQKGFLIMCFCFIVPLYFLMVITFSYAIYPNIPASRGGGDFDGAPNVVLYYKNDQTVKIPVEIKEGGISQPLVLIEKTDDYFYLADPSVAGGPKAWRSRKQRPNIISLNQESVFGFVFQSEKTFTN